MIRKVYKGVAKTTDFFFFFLSFKNCFSSASFQVIKGHISRIKVYTINILQLRLHFAILFIDLHHVGG